jgi:hypothetical protein
MPGINAGILTNAYPLTAEQIRELEQRVRENREAFAYLNENCEICFALPGGAGDLKDLAWHHVYELTTDEKLSTKTAYNKTGLDTFKSKGTEATLAAFTEEANELGTTIII